jgi:hypothetical protein
MTRSFISPLLGHWKSIRSFRGGWEKSLQLLDVHQAPRANAFAERWVGTVRRECLDHMLIFGRRHLQRVLDAYAEHYNGARRHRGIDIRPPDAAPRLARTCGAPKLGSPLD